MLALAPAVAVALAASTQAAEANAFPLVREGRAAAVLVGTLGHSPLIDGLVAAGRLDVSRIRDGWERYLITIVDDPLSGVPRALVVAGSDRRGTAFGVFTVSEKIGVSPWRWWADVLPTKRPTVELPAGLHLADGPVVRYRGFFLNDED